MVQERGAWFTAVDSSWLISRSNLLCERSAVEILPTSANSTRPAACSNRRLLGALGGALLVRVVVVIDACWPHRLRCCVRLPWYPVAER